MIAARCASAPGADGRLAGPQPRPRLPTAGLAVASILALGLPSCGAGGNPGPQGNADSGSEGPSAPGVATDDASSRRLRLVNPRVYPVIIYGSAGAGEVLFDTLPPRDSTLLDVRVAAAFLRLRAVDGAGNELATGYIDLSGQPNDRRTTAERSSDEGAELRWELTPRP
ncbi:MAG: hypothetical protein JSV95_06575 [Gemmatimonadota bacterium]|nr:MAG: hypothetical protein JSV95_06575 [Gemmatimonadota bacterium]